ncbi:MAG TPA: SDR family NAD(P)-dependent oxidoreductase [Stellaceae bacterium]|nr:SDR family NAD(P)-dependent oxidoreductase [Stellaceae bacterium]
MKVDKLFDVKGHVAMVTGAANGIGLAMAEVMAENGATVLLTDVDSVGLEKETKRLAGSGCKVESQILDASNRDAIEACVAGLAKKHGRLDAVFANAGISAGPEGRQLETSWATWDKVVALNLTGVFSTIRAAAAAMKPRKSGRIVITASIAGLRGEHLVGYAYAATKAAVCNLAKQAAIELSPFNITVNAICPGPFYTNIAGGRLFRDPEFVKAFEKEMPMGRIAKVDEIKGLALLLASPASSYITGTAIPIDGGALSW